MALIKCIAGNYQGALMVPTEILAEQHFLEFKNYAAPLGINIELLVGSMKKSKKVEILDKVKNDKIDILIGTHSLIQETVIFKNLGLIVIDEQHRFGVEQRNILRQKGYNPDMLVMTATPIPRTLALILYGDLDISLIDELPPGRKEIVTRYVTEKNRQKAYQFIKKELIKGRQCYIVCPLIEENEKNDLEAAQTLTEKLKKDVFPEFTVEILHGKLNTSIKEEIMNNFRNGTISILVSTTVIEVGVDVKNANIIVIEDSERFGLAQLHQLRGRIGRGNYRSYCILMGKPKTNESKKRINIMIKTNNGFIIAEEDLKLRGPGDFFGLRQHGLPELRIADIFKDKTLLKCAREDIFKVLKDDSIISLKEKKIIEKYLKKIIISI
jgi:ATP-dependent DNA helicase RecG